MNQPIGGATFQEQLHDLYNDLRKALYNREYYGRRLKTVRRWNLALEIIVALGSSGAIATWVFWKKGIGPDVWATIAAISTIIAILKPIFNLSKQIEKYSRLFSGHSDVAHDLEEVAREVKKNGVFKDETELFYKRIKDHWKSLAADDDPKPNKKLADECYTVVNTKYPPTSFWLPE